ncbi:hypothetical protein EPA93_33695 [Ktedonosporobacter rubrisoli]|uniref:DUF304 domain-containing protein n=1 Tax=Ktedonosporobacter rubrisoli TaxID=2509675 RepID=A0A4P6JYT2_KTERU|nr:hypothetical protein [Ktedonosporobacter rubrisoli]QBD80662.1 hypothetical protein EPA93_33695 [Ktedonosporobacter rubrisoli]
MQQQKMEFLQPEREQKSSRRKIDIQEVLRQELSEREQLLWYGQPDPWQCARKRLLAGILGLAGFLFCAFIFLMSLFGLTTFIVTIFYSLIIFTPAFLGICTPIRDYLEARSTLYAITNQRILFITLRPRRVVNTYRGSIGNIERVEQRRGERGTLTFGTKQQFINIPNARHVEHILLNFR